MIGKTGEKNSLKAKGLLADILKTAGQWIAPFFWRKKDGSVILDNGSVFFVASGRAIFGVTADHVFQRHLELISDLNNVSGQIGRLPFPLEKRLIDRNEFFDLATFDILPEELRRLGLAAMTAWPPVNVKKEDEVVVVGYLGKSRTESNSQNTDSELFFHLVVVKSVSERNISCVFKREDLRAIPGFGLNLKGDELGGLSGGPLLILRQGDDRSFWSLAGVLRANNLQLERVLATPAHLISADGSLRKSIAKIGSLLP